ncbi:hypothetical protein [Paenibacillus sp. FSL R5-0519]|uniref:hypothetical protein n=1 Tax=Paenibacillus sp. FSL R5-0519 TaxID=2921648 RepID=UPI0030DBA6BE
MSTFTQKEVKRAIRDFEVIATSLLNASSTHFSARVTQFIDFIERNLVINSVLGEYLNLPIKIEDIESDESGWLQVSLPSEMDYQIAYILQTLVSFRRDENAVINYTFHLYKNKGIDYNIQLFNEDMLQPIVREIFNRLEDLVEDEVEGKDNIPSSSLSITHIGDIIAHTGSNIAVGKNITQNLKTGDIRTEIIDKLKEQGAIPEDKISEVEPIIAEIEEVLSDESNPNSGKLKDLVGKVYNLGKNAALTVFKDTIKDPRWSSAIADFFLGGN